MTLKGDCEEAFNFYKEVFGGEFAFVGRFKDMPHQKGTPPMPEEMLEKIMHRTLPNSNENMLYGTDPLKIKRILLFHKNKWNLQSPPQILALRSSPFTSYWI